MGKKVTVFDEKSDPNAKITDPSETLTPYTVDRLMDEQMESKRMHASVNFAI